MIFMDFLMSEIFNEAKLRHFWVLNNKSLNFYGENIIGVNCVNLRIYILFKFYFE